MANCKSCGCKRNTARLVSEGAGNVQNSTGNNQNCYDVCTNPVYGTPGTLGIMAPLIYDEIGVNLCTTFTIDEETPVSEQFPTATNAAVRVIGLDYTNGATGVTVENISTRPNCYLVTLTDITVQFEMKLYDECCRYLGTLYPEAVYLPSDTTAATYNEDTNPSSVEMEIFAPYGTAVEITTVAEETVYTPVVNSISLSTTNNFVTQGINMYALPKLLDFDYTDNTITVGLTLVVNSLYFAGYMVPTTGRIQTPKGSIVPDEDTDCMQFVEGDLLNLAIKPLSLGDGCGCNNSTDMKNDCTQNSCTGNIFG